MKELLVRGACYNAWANGLFTAIIRELPDELLDKEIPSSFPSIRKTVLHVWASEDTWLQRLEGVAAPVWVQATFTGSIGEACDRWEERSTAIVRLVESMDAGALEQRLAYKSLKGDPQHDRIDAILQHMFNHATYHRGQLVTMLRQCGVTGIPGTDLITFERITTAVES